MTMKGDEVEIQPVESHKYLFTTSTCPNCRMAKKMLEGEELEIIDAEQNPELVKQYGIRQAPTLVITDGAQVKKYVNASNIQKYVDVYKRQEHGLPLTVENVLKSSRLHKRCGTSFLFLVMLVSICLLYTSPAEGFVTGTGIEGYRDETAFHAAEQTGFCKSPGKSFSAIQDRGSLPESFEYHRL